MSIKVETLEELYNKACSIESDINQHIPTLKNYSTFCRSVAEFGVRGGTSTIALLSGLKIGYDKFYIPNLDLDQIKSYDPNYFYIGVDIQDCPITEKMKDLANINGLNYTFIKEDSAKVVIPEVDLLFIDSWHIYGHLKRELENNHSRVKNYIIMHDTTVDEWRGESLRESRNIEKEAEQSGYPIEEITKGLWPAIEEFLIKHPEWKIEQRFTNNNGLTILKRV
jgi:hypothetical protein